jgi:hypothetical protein
MTVSLQHPLEELRAQQRLIRAPNLKDPGYIRQEANSKLWVRERIAALLDPDSFIEVGSITGRPILNEQGELESFIPAYVQYDMLYSCLCLFFLLQELGKRMGSRKEPQGVRYRRRF